MIQTSSSTLEFTGRMSGSWNCSHIFLSNWWMILLSWTRRSDPNEVLAGVSWTGCGKEEAAAFLRRKSEDRGQLGHDVRRVDFLVISRLEEKQKSEKLVQYDGDRWVSSESGGYVHRVWVGCGAAGPGWWRGAVVRSLWHHACSIRSNKR